MLFMLNNPVGSNDLVSALGQDRLQLGFPGAGGTLDGHIVRYALISQQPTSLGELNGGVTRLRDANAARDFRLREDAANAEDGAADDEVSCHSLNGRP
jgi:hypothetical protein